MHVLIVVEMVAGAVIAIVIIAVAIAVLPRSGETFLFI